MGERGGSVLAGIPLEVMTLPAGIRLLPARRGARMF